MIISTALDGYDSGYDVFRHQCHDLLVIKLELLMLILIWRNLGRMRLGLSGEAWDVFLIGSRKIVTGIKQVLADVKGALPNS